MFKGERLKNESILDLKTDDHYKNLLKSFNSCHSPITKSAFAKNYSFETSYRTKEVNLWRIHLLDQKSNCKAIMRGDRQNHIRSLCRPSLTLSLWETEKCLIMDNIFFCKCKNTCPHTIGMRTDRKCVHSCKKMSNVPRCVTGHDGDKATRCAIEWKFSLHYIHRDNLIIGFPLCKIGTLEARKIPSTLDKTADSWICCERL